MITKLKVANFKSHRDTELALGNLTVITGANSVGKSSIIQSLLLLRQTFQKKGFKQGLDLTGPLCIIGTADEAWHQGANGNPVVFELTYKEHSLCWSFDPKDAEDLSFIPLDTDTTSEIDLETIALFNNNFQYISVLRSPEYAKNDIIIQSEKQISINLGKGELVAHYLFQYGKKTIDARIAQSLGIEPESDEAYLLEQTQIWEQAISTGITLRAEKTSEGAMVMKYGYKAYNDNRPLKDLRPENVGFGVSYTLPVIVSLLSASPGALVLIENPEAHLHPEGQSKIAELIALVAQSGVQIVIETHSDHIINGILVACKKFEETHIGIDKKHVAMYYMGGKDEKHATIVDAINIVEGGKIEYQPKGFFDRAEADLSFLMGF